MKLNPDCIRDILLFVEDHPPNAEIVLADPLPPALSAYTFDEIKYHSEQCYLSGFLKTFRLNILDEIKTDCLTPAGNQFLNDIRSDTAWKKAKSTASKVGAFSLDFLAKIAANVAAELIKKQIT